MEHQVGTKTLELVVFRLAEGVSHEEFMATVDSVSEWVQTQPGFISRELSYSADSGKYVEVVYWETLEQAERAGQASESSEQCLPMFNTIRIDDMQFLHAETLLTTVAS